MYIKFQDKLFKVLIDSNTEKLMVEFYNETRNVRDKIEAYTTCDLRKKILQKSNYYGSSDILSPLIYILFYKNKLINLR